jgi:hypothetical protein
MPDLLVSVVTGGEDIPSPLPSFLLFLDACKEQDWRKDSDIEVTPLLLEAQPCNYEVTQAAYKYCSLGEARGARFEWRETASGEVLYCSFMGDRLEMLDSSRRN